jgi:Carboxypeptidase regulatory-like domain
MKRIRTIALGLSMAAVFTLGLPSVALADIVSGRVFGPDEKPLVSVSLTAKDAKGESIPIKSDKDGNFRVYLDPGKYTVTYAGDATVEGTVEGYPQPFQQDIHLKKKGK